MNLNPLDLSGPAFLAFYVFALIAAHFVGEALTLLCRSKHADSANLPENLQPAEAAFLAGGTERAVDTALVRLLHDDLIAVKPGGGGFETKAAKADTLQLSDLQRDVYREIARNNGSVDALHRLKSAFLARTEVRLSSDRLLLARDGAEATCLRGAKASPFAAVIALGIAKILVGIARHRPVTFLVVFVLVSLVILGIKLFKLPLRSARGEAALRNLKRRNAALETTVRRRSRELDDATLLFAIALFGPQVLASSELAWMHQGFINRQSGSSDSGGGSCGGGCGGGGCGGCGG
ncbi:MAG TPA: TIGR04222 domain-containing membrane protein [Burkholderiaceae bacterium]|nr:TIGR04222 domain-containing membrane protein [Burkholderiaceae bacterium]